MTVSNSRGEGGGGGKKNPSRTPTVTELQWRLETELAFRGARG